MIKKRSTIRSPQLKKRKRKLMYVKGVAFVLAAAAIISGLSALSKLDSLEVSRVEGEGNVLVTDSELWKAIDAATRGNYLGLFSKKNALLFPKAKALAAVTAVFPILEGAEIDLKDPKTARVKVHEREPSALWCELIDGAFSSDCHFLDRNGFVYSDAPEFKGDVYMRYYGGIADAGADPVGRNFLDPVIFRSLDSFADGVRNLDLGPVALLAKEDGDFVLHLKNGGMIFLNQREPLEKSLLNLETVLAEQIKSDGDRRRIDYIDLRYGNKVFFKLR